MTSKVWIVLVCVMVSGCITNRLNVESEDRTLTQDLKEMSAGDDAIMCAHHPYSFTEASDLILRHNGELLTVLRGRLGLCYKVHPGWHGLSVEARNTSMQNPYSTVFMKIEPGQKIHLLISDSDALGQKGERVGRYVSWLTAQEADTQYSKVKRVKVMTGTAPTGEKQVDFSTPLAALDVNEIPTCPDPWRTFEADDTTPAHRLCDRLDMSISVLGQTPTDM